MNYLIVNDKKEAFCEQRVFYINENKFEKLRVSIPKALLGSYTAYLILKVNNLETPFELNMSEIKGCMVSQEIEITEEFTVGSGFIRAWVEFRQGANLGMTNSVMFEIDNVETNAPVNPPAPSGSGVQDVQINNRTVVDSTGVAKILSKSNYTNDNKLVTEDDIEGFITQEYVDEKISEEVENRNEAISQHNSDENAHPYIQGLFDNYYTKDETDTEIENRHDNTKADKIVILADDSTEIGGYTVPVLTQEEVEQASLGIISGNKVVVGLDDVFLSVINADVVEEVDRIYIDYLGVMTLIYSADGSIDYLTATAKEIVLSGTEGTLTQEQYDALINEGGYIKLGTKIYRYFEDNVNYRTFLNISAVSHSSVTFSCIYINTNSIAVNYKHWSVEDLEIPLGVGKVVPIGSYQYVYESKVLPAIPVDILRQVYTDDKNGVPQVLYWSIYGTENNLKVVSSDLIAGTYSIDILVHNQYHCAYEWNENTTGNVNPVVASGGEQKVDDVKVNNVSVLTNKVANIDLTPYALLGSGNTFEHEQEIKGGMYSGVKVVNSSDNQNYAVLGYEGIQIKTSAGQTATNIPFDEIATIDDTSTTSTTETWSAYKLNNTIGDIETLMANLYNGGGAV